MNSKALMNIELKILDPRVSENLPKIATPGSAGADLRALLDTPLVLAPGRGNQTRSYRHRHPHRRSALRRRDPAAFWSGS